MPTGDIPFTTYAFPVTATGATPRSMPTRLTDHISVMDFGADPSAGTTADNSVAFGKAIAAATRSSKACGRVFVPRGSYRFANSVQLIPGLTTGTSNSFSVVGEAPGCTQLYGAVNGFILDGGPNLANQTGGFSVENLLITNTHATPFTTGCIRLGGVGARVQNCILQGMVGAAFINAKAARISDCYIKCAGGSPMGGAPGAGTIGIAMMADGAVIANIAAGECDIVVAMSGTGINVNGCHFEVCRIGFAAGYGSHSLGSGSLKGLSMYANSSEALGIYMDIVGPCSGGYVGSFGGQMHSSPSINPIDGSDYALAVLRIADGLANGMTFFSGQGGVAGPSDPNAAVYMIGMPPTGSIRTGGSFFKGCTGSLIDRPQVRLPGTAGGGAAVAGAANCARFQQGEFIPVWSYNDLPWGTITGATITSGTTLAYSGSTRLTPEIGAVLSGSGVTPGTRIVSVDTVAKTGVVDKTQSVSSTTMTFYCNNPGDQYEINDANNPLWTGSVSNAGRPVTGGGSNRVTVAFKETIGYTIVG